MAASAPGITSSHNIPRPEGKSLISFLVLLFERKNLPWSLPADFSILILGQNCITLLFLNQSLVRGMELLWLVLIVRIHCQLHSWAGEGPSFSWVTKPSKNEHNLGFVREWLWGKRPIMIVITCPLRLPLASIHNTFLFLLKYFTCLYEQNFLKY